MTDTRVAVPRYLVSREIERLQRLRLMSSLSPSEQQEYVDLCELERELSQHERSGDGSSSN